MFIRYQKVRNTVVGTVAAAGAGVAAIFGFGGDPDPPKSTDNASVTANVTTAEDHAVSPPVVRVDTMPSQPTALAEQNIQREVAAEQTPSAAAYEPEQSKVVQTRPRSPKPDAPFKVAPARQPSKAERYTAAMQLANTTAHSSGKGKDVLGPTSPWKLNLYDDNRDGVWDRGKLDTNRDDVDDENWTFKQGRWEKDNGRRIWVGNQWVDGRQVARQSTGVDATLARYRNAMKIAHQRADPSGKGKDVLGASSPWKLNLYDDNRDGVWDRGKLDTNRDDVDDEKWNFKQGRWEKDGGSLIWIDNQWANGKQVGQQLTRVNSTLARYRNAMKIANQRAAPSGKGKDVLGASSPWKLNLYDDNRDGVWDRGKLDTNRDDVDDEKWNFKQGRWEKDGGKLLWQKDAWVRPEERSTDVTTGLYRTAMKAATSRAHPSGKAKDVLGASSPWKLNLYDDNKDGVWDRGKLDTNRDDTDDEKWNFKQNRWEKDGGRLIWKDNRWQAAKK